MMQTHMVIHGTKKIIAKKEIIIAAGTFKTPHLLQLSGMFPPVFLELLDGPSAQAIKKRRPIHHRHAHA